MMKDTTMGRPLSQKEKKTRASDTVKTATFLFQVTLTTTGSTSSKGAQENLKGKCGN